MVMSKLRLDRVERHISNAKSSPLNVFFPDKTQELGIAFRTTFCEWGT